MRAAEYMKERVIKGRIVAQAVVDQRAAAIAQPDFDQYMADQIDEATLKQRKAEAREKATAEHAQLTELERASAEYTEAVSARTKAEAALATSEAAEDAAEAKLEAVLQPCSPGLRAASRHPSLSPAEASPPEPALRPRAAHCTRHHRRGVRA